MRQDKTAGSTRQDSMFTSDHRTAIAVLMNTSSYFIFCHGFIKIGLSFEESGVIQDMINAAAMSGCDDEGWFVYTVSRMEDRLGFKRDAQQRLITSLIDQGYIETAKRGNPAKRHVRVDTVKLANALASLPRKSSEREIPPTTRPEIPLSTRPEIPSTLLSNSLSKGREAREDAADAARSLNPLVEKNDDKGTSQDNKGPRAQDKNKQESVAWSARCARRLRAIITDKLKIRRAYSEQRWSQEFMSLARDWGQDKVEQVLSWYENNHQKRRIQSASSFRSQFEVLEGMQSRSTPEEQVGAMPDKASLLIVDELSDLGWPKGSKAKLPAAVAKSLTYMTAFFVVVEDVTHRLRRDKSIPGVPKHEQRSLASYAERLLDELGTTADDATRKWFKRVFKRVKGWSEWSGDMTAYVFSTESKMLHQIMDDCSSQYCGKTKYTAMLLDAVEKCS